MRVWLRTFQATVAESMRPPDVLLDPHTVLELDVLCIRSERLAVVTDHNVGGAPDLVVEALSDRTRDADFGKAHARHA